MDWDDWNSDSVKVGEEFADMFMNWAFDSFADNTGGDARYQWMQSHMSVWLNRMAR
jgi:hypothetical protein